MCQSLGRAPVISIADVESSVPELPTDKSRAKLNPLADTFVSSRSESETSSVGDDLEAHPAAAEHPQLNPEDNAEPAMDPRYPGPNDAHMYGGYGWESPQGVLPGGHDGQHRAASPPPGAYYPWPPAHAPYYHVYPMPDRGGSPPPPPGLVFPAGSSPPLAPGFISIPVGHPSHPHSMGPPPSLGSSPPNGGHYLYIPPPGGPPHPQQHAQVAPADLQRSLSTLSLEGGSPRSVGSTGSGRTRASARIARSHRAGGAYNPSDFEFKPASAGGDASKTAVMIRNIPNRYTQGVVLDLLGDAGLGGAFDFIYVPIDYRSRAGLGYAFVNFVSHAAACAAWTAFHGRRWEEFQSQKVCQVTYARVQGRDALVEHFKTAKFPSTDAEFCPLVFAHEREGGAVARAHSPAPIHDYLARLAAAADGEAADGEADGGEEA